VDVRWLLTAGGIIAIHSGTVEDEDRIASISASP
jgi:hypothetical protein